MAERVGDPFLSRSEQRLVEFGGSRLGWTDCLVANLHAGDVGEVPRELDDPTVQGLAPTTDVPECPQRGAHLLVPLVQRVLCLPHELLQAPGIAVKQNGGCLEHHALVGEGVPHGVVDFPADAFAFSLHGGLLDLQRVPLVLHVGIDQPLDDQVLLGVGDQCPRLPPSQRVGRSGYRQHQGIHDDHSRDIARRDRRQWRVPGGGGTLLQRQERHGHRDGECRGEGLYDQRELGDQDRRKHQFQQDPVTQGHADDVDHHPLRRKRHQIHRVGKIEQKDNRQRR